MRFCAHTYTVRNNRALQAALFVLAACGSSAQANEVAMVAAGDSAPSPSLDGEPVNGAGSRVYLAAATGRVTVGRAADGEGRRMHAARSQNAGSASVVSFSIVPVRARIQALSSSFAAPLARAALTSRFGAARPSSDGGTRAHAGVDLAAPIGSPVQAAMAGRVSAAGWAGGYGLLVVVDHGGGLQTRYAHLSRIGVVAGQQIHQGDTVGLVGSTGHSTGPHLHYELRQDGRPLNPLSH